MVVTGEQVLGPPSAAASAQVVVSFAPLHKTYAVMSPEPVHVVVQRPKNPNEASPSESCESVAQQIEPLLQSADLAQLN